MGKKKPVPLKASVPCPTDEEAKSYADLHRLALENGENPRTYFTTHEYDEIVRVLTTWGVNSIFFVYAFPPAGFEVCSPEDAENLKVFEGWILQYVPQTNRFNLLVKASRDGYDLFWQEQRKHKLGA